MLCFFYIEESVKCVKDENRDRTKSKELLRKEKSYSKTNVITERSYVI